jgi:hypothetical protein
MEDAENWVSSVASAGTFFFARVQISFGALPASYPIAAEGSFLEDKTTGA